MGRLRRRVFSRSPSLSPAVARPARVRRLRRVFTRSVSPSPVVASTGRQLRLEDCKGVVRARHSFIHATGADVERLHKRLVAAGDRDSKVLKVLGLLSLCTQHLDGQTLVTSLKKTGVGRTCGALRQHVNQEVRGFASRLVESWREAVQAGKVSGSQVLRSTPTHSRPVASFVAKVSAVPIACDTPPHSSTSSVVEVRGSPTRSSTSSSSSSGSSSRSSSPAASEGDGKSPALAVAAA